MEEKEEEEEEKNNMFGKEVATMTNIPFGTELS